MRTSKENWCRSLEAEQEWCLCESAAPQLEATGPWHAARAGDGARLNQLSKQCPNEEWLLLLLLLHAPYLHG